MARLIARRLALGVLTLFLISLVVFAAVLALPGDAATAILGKEATPERVAALRDQLNLIGNAGSAAPGRGGSDGQSQSLRRTGCK